MQVQQETLVRARGRLHFWRRDSDMRAWLLLPSTPLPQVSRDRMVSFERAIHAIQPISDLLDRLDEASLVAQYRLTAPVIKSVLGR